MTTFYSDMFASKEWDTVAAQGEAKDGFPKGVLKVIISSCDIKPSSKDPQSLVQHIELKVIEGDYKDSTIKDYANIINSNDVAVRIGKSRIRSYIDATGVTPQKGFEELKGKPFKIRTDHTLDSFVSKSGDNAGQLVPTVRVEIKGIYSMASEVKGEELALVSTNDTLNSPEGLAFKTSLRSNGGSSIAPAAIPTSAPKAPPAAPRAAPPAAMPKAPVVTDVNSDEIPF